MTYLKFELNEKKKKLEFHVKQKLYLCGQELDVWFGENGKR